MDTKQEKKEWQEPQYKRYGDMSELTTQKPDGNVDLGMQSEGTGTGCQTGVTCG